MALQSMAWQAMAWHSWVARLAEAGIQTKRALCDFGRTAPLVIPGTGAAEAAPVRSMKPHREAPAEVVDPETTLASKHLASTQEGGQHEFPAKLRANGEVSR